MVNAFQWKRGADDKISFSTETQYLLRVETVKF